MQQSPAIVPQETKTETSHKEEAHGVFEQTAVFYKPEEVLNTSKKLNIHSVITIYRLKESPWQTSCKNGLEVVPERGRTIAVPHILRFRRAEYVPRRATKVI